MSLPNLLRGLNLGNEFDVGILVPNRIKLKIGPGLTRALDGTISATAAGPTLAVWSDSRAAGSDNGTTQGWSRGATIARTGAGRWTVTFATAHPDGTSYHVSTICEEQSNLRDTPDLTIVQGSKTANGFQIQITTGDNGGGADTYVDTPWSFSVSESVNVIGAP